MAITVIVGCVVACAVAVDCTVREGVRGASSSWVGFICSSDRGVLVWGGLIFDALDSTWHETSSINNKAKRVVENMWMMWFWVKHFLFDMSQF
jgi:hypothetical protein